MNLTTEQKLLYLKDYFDEKNPGDKIAEGGLEELTELCCQVFSKDQEQAFKIIVCKLVIDASYEVMTLCKQNTISPMTPEQTYEAIMEVFSRMWRELIGYEGASLDVSEIRH